MIFVSSQFIVFFLIILTGFALIEKHPRYRAWLLLCANLIFYSWAGLYFLPLLLVVAGINYLAGHYMSLYTSQRKRILIGAIVLNLTLLAFFKYMEFFYGQVNALLQLLGLHAQLPAFFADMLFPIGISFYTFQAIAYCAEQYKNPDQEPASFPQLLLYLSFFPTVLAGPIMRPTQFFPQLQWFCTTSFKPDETALSPFLPDRCLERASAYIISGLFKKVVLASYLSEFVVRDAFQGPEGFSSWGILMAVYAYAVQIYCDFSGYTDMAIGVALLLGFSLPINFNGPYTALNLQDFWRRWHISLSTWLRDYLYIPLGGSRKGNRYMNLIITMLLGGLWHGGHIRFIIWGALHGVGLAVVHAFHTFKQRFIQKKQADRFPGLQTLGRLAAWLLTFHFVCFAWIFFRAEDMARVEEIIRRLVHWGQEGHGFPALAIPAICIGIFIQYIGPKCFSSFVDWLTPHTRVIQAVILGLLAAAIFRLGPDGMLPFIYFQF